MSWSRDITGVDAAKKGTYRSLNGAADENTKNNGNKNSDKERAEYLG